MHDYMTDLTKRFTPQVQRPDFFVHPDAYLSQAKGSAARHSEIKYSGRHRRHRCSRMLAGSAPILVLALRSSSFAGTAPGGGVDSASRVILLDSEVLRPRGDFERILVHELFHFAWVRLSNEPTLGLGADPGSRVRTRSAKGELGWSAERRKNKLASRDMQRRARAWRLYACESFCDTAAWRFAGVQRHEDFTLAARFRLLRGEWFRQHIESRTVLI